MACYLKTSFILSLIMAIISNIKSDSNFIVVEDQTTQKTHNFLFNVCQYDVAAKIFYSFGCDSTRFWYSQASDNACSNDVSTYIFDENLYRVNNCPANSGSGYTTTATNVILTSAPQGVGNTTVINNNTRLCIGGNETLGINFCMNNNNYRCYYNHKNEHLECYMIYNNATCKSNTTSLLQCYNMDHITNDTNGYIRCLYETYHSQHHANDSNHFIYCNYSTNIISVASHKVKGHKHLFRTVGIPLIVIFLLLCCILIFCCCFYRCCRRDKTKKQEPKYDKIHMKSNQPSQNISVKV
jgi:hypothetical protein